MERLLTGSGGAGLRVRAAQTGRADKSVKEERALRHTDVLPLLSNHQHHHHINLTCSLRQLLSLFQNDKSHCQGTFPSSATPQILGDQAFRVLILTPPSKYPTSDWVAPRWPAQPHHCCLPPPVQQSAVVCPTTVTREDGVQTGSGDSSWGGQFAHWGCWGHHGHAGRLWTGSVSPTKRLLRPADRSTLVPGPRCLPPSDKS